MTDNRTRQDSDSNAVPSENLVAGNPSNGSQTSLRKVTPQELQVPDLNLNWGLKNGKLTVDMNLTGFKSGSETQTPFVEVTKNEAQQLAGAVQKAIISKLTEQKLDVTDATITYTTKTGAKYTQEAMAELDDKGKAAVLAKLTGVSITAGVGSSVSVNSEQGRKENLLTTGDSRIAKAMDAGEREYDEKRMAAYQQRSKEWANGATNGNTGETVNRTLKTSDAEYTIRTDVAADYYNSTKWFPWEKIKGAETTDNKRSEAPEQTGTQIASNVSPQPTTAVSTDSKSTNNMVSSIGSDNKAIDLKSGVDHKTTVATNALEDRNNPLNKVYEQTLAGVKAQGIDDNKVKDVAVALVQQGMQNGFKANSDDPVSVVAGNKNVVIAFQGEAGNPATPTAGVNPSNVQTNSAPTLAQTLTQQYTPTTNVALDDQKQKQSNTMAIG
jgi:hypothetical protein